MGLVLVTGGAGFIGSHVVEGLLAAGESIRVVDNLATGQRRNLAACEGRYEWLEGDLADYGVCERAVEGVSAVVHQAAIPSVPRSVAAPRESHESGPTATLNLLEAARKSGSARRFVYASSSSVYGDAPSLPKHEGIPPAPLSPYAAGKFSGELYVQVYARTMGLDGVSLRYFNIFGPRQDPSSPYSGVISLFAKALLEGRRPLIFGDGGQTRDFTYVANAVAANLAALYAKGPLGGAAVNVGTGQRVSLLTLLNQMNRALGTEILPEFGPERAGDVRDSEASIERARDLLGYEVGVDFEEGLRRTLAWCEGEAAAGR